MGNEQPGSGTGGAGGDENTATPDRNLLAKISKPGDGDLDVFIEGLTVTAVLRYSGGTNDEIVARFIGGTGWWIGHDGDLVDDGVDVDIDATISYTGADPGVHDGICSVLERWRDDATPVLIVSAPVRLMTLWASPQTWIPLPRV